MLLTWKTAVRKKLIQSTQLCQANSLSHQKMFILKRTFQRIPKKGWKKIQIKKNSNTLPFPFAFYQRPFLPAPTNDANSVISIKHRLACRCQYILCLVRRAFKVANLFMYKQCFKSIQMLPQGNSTWQLLSTIKIYLY